MEYTDYQITAFTEATFIIIYDMVKALRSMGKCLYLEYTLFCLLICWDSIFTPLPAMGISIMETG